MKEVRYWGPKVIKIFREMTFINKPPKSHIVLPLEITFEKRAINFLWSTWRGNCMIYGKGLKVEKYFCFMIPRKRLWWTYFQAALVLLSAEVSFNEGWKIHANRIIESNYLSSVRRSFPLAIKTLITAIELWKTPHAQVDHDRGSQVRVTSQAINLDGDFQLHFQ